MSQVITRRSLFQTSGAFLASGLVLPGSLTAWAAPSEQQRIRLNLNENAWGPSPTVAPAIEKALTQISRYGEPSAAQALVEQIAAYERVAPEQIIPGEILVELGLYLGSQGGPGGEFLYSTPGYLALIDAASRVGGVGIGVPLNPAFENDLPALASRITPRTRAIFLVNPHNPTGTVSDSTTFHGFLRNVSQHATAIVDEAYLEYTDDFAQRSAASKVRDGANVIVFRTFVKIHGLAGLPIGYAIVPKEIGKFLRKQGLGDAEALGRLNMAAASAALADQAHVAHVRAAVASERAKWHAVLDELKLRYTDSRASFVFFDSGRPHDEIASAFAAKDIEVARAFPPYNNWVRITIGLPEENLRAQQQLRRILAH
ncbi:pyridoxal phosphate-dependent aminotransferase [Terracidiphilus gabretensis]|uniref:pyridoxal phosphate-dependent aminotransferase n=1 Tax=Terracidiphilus gabretensis TaxID=1577687 RepID=UPI000AD89BE2|nr:aminotransferase class I/II-fold pyridoxal phosphate-dependent enzyme [Terracidiphilus gabretensis]